MVDALHGIKLLDAQRKLLVGHVEQARVFDGDGGLSGKRRQHFGIFFDENATVLLVEHLQHTNSPPPHHQRHRQNSAGAKFPLIVRVGRFQIGLLLGRVNVTVPARITHRVVDDNRRAALDGRSGQPGSCREPRADQFLTAPADHNMKLKVAGLLIDEQQATRLGVENLDGVLGDQLQQPVHVAHLGRKLVGDLIDGGKLAGALLRLFEKLELVDGAGSEIRNIPEKVLLVVAKHHPRFGSRRHHHPQHAFAGVGQKGHAHPRFQARVLRRGMRIACQRFPDVIVGAQRRLRAGDFANQVAPHAPAPAFHLRNAIVPLVVENVIQLVGVGVAQGNIETRRIDHAQRLRVDEFQQRVKINGKVQRAAHLAQYVLHLNAAFQVVHCLSALNGQRHLIAQALDEAQVFVQIRRSALTRPDGQESVQPLPPAQPDDDRRAQHRQLGPAANHFQRQGTPFFHVEQGRPLAQMAHQPAFRTEYDVCWALTGSRVGLGAVLMRCGVTHEQNHMRGRKCLLQHLPNQLRDFRQPHRVCDIARKLLQHRLVRAPGAKIDGIDLLLEIQPQRVESDSHTEDREHNQHGAERRIPC